LDVADYEENRHFFLSHYFRNRYDQAMSNLPNITTGIEINRVEIWVTNKTGTTSNSRNIIAVANLGESGQYVPSNNTDGLYNMLSTQYAEARDIDQTNTVLANIPGFESGRDYEKLASARLLTSSEYTVNKSLGYVSLKSGLQTDQVLAVAFEFTSGGVTYKVGEFAADITETSKALYVKALKNTSNNPQQANWNLMMKNVYYLATSVEKEKFRLDIKYQSDTTGTYLTYLPEEALKATMEDPDYIAAASSFDTNFLDHEATAALIEQQQAFAERLGAEFWGE
jgi:cell surface protein SprA